MQKEIYKLKRRTHHVEQMLANYTKTSHPIIRIPRLTKGKHDNYRYRQRCTFIFLDVISDEISTICVHDKQTQQHVPPMIAEGNGASSPVIVNNNESISK
jgi:hypothetical protein